jgi:broad specificity phosphatase PhoE
MILYSIRHSDKEIGDYWDAGKRIMDNPLSIEGKEKAKSLERHFTGKTIGRIITSRYTRSKDTGRILAEAIHSDLHENQLLDEIDMEKLIPNMAK